MRKSAACSTNLIAAACARAPSSCCGTILVHLGENGTFTKTINFERDIPAPLIVSALGTKTAGQRACGVRWPAFVTVIERAHEHLHDRVVWMRSGDISNHYHASGGWSFLDTMK